MTHLPPQGGTFEEIFPEKLLKIRNISKNKKGTNIAL
jgi:hypothetical protein